MCSRFDLHGGRKGDVEVQLAICWCPRRVGQWKCGRSWQELCEGEREKGKGKGEERREIEGQGREKVET